jgi:aspartyl-tRNA(Asn)/glutamyl-tRNA(Gln) amidotransferase subunit A
VTATDPTQMAATELVARYRQRTLSPVEVAKAVLARIEKLNPAVNACCHLDPAVALAGAMASEARWMRGEPQGLVDGVPVTIKDLTQVRGWPTRRGSKLTNTAPAATDAPAVKTLRDHGSVLLGKTTTPEFGWKGLTDSPLTGITRNPWNTAMTTGGSSGGAGAAAVLGLGALHTGTDGAGSVRIPASFCGCFGLKPTYGRIPLYPASPMGSLAVLGPMTRTVADAALMMSVMAAPDPRDPTAERGQAPDYRIGLEGGIRGLRIAYSPRLGGHAKRVDPEVEAITGDAVKTLETLGALVELADPAMPESLFDVLMTQWSAGSATVLDSYGPGAGKDSDPGFVAMAERGRKVSATDYLRAGIARVEWVLAMEKFHERFDLLVTPTLAVTAFEAGRDTPADGTWGGDWLSWTPFTYPFNLSYQPAASCPAGFSKSGLPVGLQIVGRAGADALVLRAARAFESQRGFKMCENPPGLVS